MWPWLQSPDFLESGKGARSAMQMRHSERWIGAYFLFISNRLHFKRKVPGGGNMVSPITTCRDLISCIFGGQGGPLIYLGCVLPNFDLCRVLCICSVFPPLHGSIHQKWTPRWSKKFREPWMSSYGSVVCLVYLVALFQRRISATCDRVATSSQRRRKYVHLSASGLLDEPLKQRTLVS